MSTSATDDAIASKTLADPKSPGPSQASGSSPLSSHSPDKVQHTLRPNSRLRPLYQSVTLITLHTHVVASGKVFGAIASFVELVDLWTSKNGSSSKNAQDIVQFVFS